MTHDDTCQFLKVEQNGLYYYMGSLCMSVCPDLLLCTMQQSSMWTQTHLAAEGCPSSPSNREQSRRPSLAGSRIGIPTCGRQIRWTESVLASEHNAAAPSPCFLTRLALCLSLFLSVRSSRPRCQNQSRLINLKGCLYASVMMQWTRLHRLESIILAVICFILTVSDLTISLMPSCLEQIPIEILIWMTSREGSDYRQVLCYKTSLFQSYMLYFFTSTVLLYSLESHAAFFLSDSMLGNFAWECAVVVCHPFM